MKYLIACFLLVSMTGFGQGQMKGVYNKEKNEFTLASGTKIRFFRYGVAPFDGYGHNLQGVVDTTGKIILEPKYYEIEGFGGGVSRVTKKTEDWEITYGFIDTLGKEILPPIYTDADDWFYRSLRFAKVLVVGKDGKYGVFDYSGKKLTPLKYQSIWEFHGGMARVYHKGKAGFIDEQGNEVIPCQYEEAKDFGLETVLVKKDGKYGWIDKQGKTVIPFEYEWASNFVGDQAKVKKDGKMFYIDREGKSKLPAKYDGVGNYKDGIAWARKGDKWGFIDELGNVVIAFEYKKVGDFDKSGRAWVWKDNGKWGHIDRDGQVTTPIIYDRASGFSHQYTGDSLFAGVQIDGKYGKVGVNGNLAIPCEYIGIDHFSQGLAKVKKQVGETYKFGFVNYVGEEIIPCVYDKVEKFDKSKNVTIVYKDGKWGLINKEGKKVVPCKYTAVRDEGNGTYSVWNKDERFLVDENGNHVKQE